MPLVCQRCQHENAEEARFCLQCGTMLEARTAQAPADPFIGKVLLGRYRVLGILGEGGMGKVYLAEQKMGTATRNVAIKTLHPQLGADPQLIARFHRECETVVSLSHPNTVQFHDFGEIDQTLFIVMEYIEGESLAHALERGAIDPARVDRILIQICGSLNEAHQRGVVHRDLKPENILLTERGGQADFVKVLDFGIAKRSEAEDKAQSKLTKQGMVLGTPPYMSPEQFSGQPLDARSDIYSLGVMTYEMLTGRLPFEAATPWEWATKHLTEPPTPLEALAEGARLPEHKKAAVHRALQKERSHRQATTLELMHELTGLHDASSAWTLATTPGAGAASSSGAAGGSSAPARPAAPTPGPMASTDMAYGPTMATPSSGQMSAATPSGAPPGLAEVPGSSRLIKVLSALAVVGLLVVAGGAGALWWAFGQTDDEPPATADADAPDPAVAGVADTEAAGRSASGGIPSTPDVAPQQEAPPAEGTEPAGEEAEAASPADETRETASPAEEASEPPPKRDRPAPRPEPTPRRNRADALLGKARAAVERNDVEAAAAALARARRSGGGHPPSLAKLQSQLGRKASNQVGILMQQGRCEDAQTLFRRLRAAGAAGPSKVHFSSDWCPQP